MTNMKILAFVTPPYIYHDDFDDKCISTNVLEDIRYGSQIHPELNARYAILKLRDSIKQAKNEQKGE